MLVTAQVVLRGHERRRDIVIAGPRPGELSTDDYIDLGHLSVRGQARLAETVATALAAMPAVREAPRERIRGEPMQELFKNWLVGFGLGLGLLIVFYGMTMPAQPFIYVGSEGACGSDVSESIVGPGRPWNVLQALRWWPVEHDRTQSRLRVSRDHDQAAGIQASARPKHRASARRLQPDLAVCCHAVDREPGRRASVVHLQDHQLGRG